MRQESIKRQIFFILLSTFIISLAFSEKMVYANTKPKKVIEMEKILPKEVGDYRAEKKDELYDRKTTFQYMNGAAELYRSYAFSFLLVRRYNKAGYPSITVELFDMGIPADAFGIFSYQTEDEEVGIGQGSDYGGGLLRFWKEKYFINVYAEKDSPEVKKDILNIGEAISKRINKDGSKPMLINFIPEEGLSQRSIRYFHLHPILNHHYFISHENILNLSAKTDAILADYSFPNFKEKTFLLLIQYPDEQQAKKGFNTFLRAYMPEVSSPNKTIKTENGKWTSAKNYKKYIMISFDSPDQEKAEGLIEIVTKKLQGK